MEILEKAIFYLATGVLTILFVVTWFSIQRFIKRLDKKFDIVFTKNDELNKDINACELAIEKVDGKLQTANEKVNGIDRRLKNVERKLAV